VVAKSKAIKLEVIIAVGHTDRFGSDAYNQKLSEKRAAAVKTYLVSKGVDSQPRLHRRQGQDESGHQARSVPGPKSKKVIECLQPDRRVDIELIGTK
jgi:OOP family OmpA-OmpF porin